MYQIKALHLKRLATTLLLIKPGFIIPNIRCRYTSQQTLFSICNENAPQHTDIVWKGLVLQTCT